MRSLIISHVRDRQAQKRGGSFIITTLRNETVEEPVDERQLSDVGEALERLAKVDPALAAVVDMKFFCGFSFAEIWRDAQSIGADRPAQLAERPYLSASELSADLSA